MWGTSLLPAFPAIVVLSGEESPKYKKVFRSVLKQIFFLSPPALPKNPIATLAPFEAGLNK